MRTTIALEDDALAILRDHAMKDGQSLGAAASELIRKGHRFQLTTKTVNGIPVFDLPPDYPVVTSDMVRQILDEDE